ncbi:four helix bundle protein [Fibrobacter sp. UWCM]|jgi:four helix bundle protein|uniref:four helix bundle protein n=1 Tax=Fibrobacter sp. UWCM TaxID=1896208 RepID=UPI000934EE6F|nr:four helix bundle protein [Fibrobacter sp. UWCM]
MNSYKDLVVWQKAIDLTIEIYSLTNLFPKEEMYGLVSQIRRSAVSIPSNIAEGQARKYHQQFSHFLSIAQGSLAELETQIIIAMKLGYIAGEQKDLFDMMHSIGKMITRLKQNLTQEEKKILDTRETIDQ